jgi:rubrerythrin
MRNVFNLLVCITVACFLTSCGGNKAPKTIENLKAAFTGESTASAKYAAFALKAKEEGLTQIALLFEAASKAENIHATNHKEVLKEMGVEAPAVDPKFEVKTTKENLEDAIKGESYEMATMYPGFIETAMTEKADKAKKSFTWANDTEKKHHEFYQAALNALNDNNVASLPNEFYVCPKCGNTFEAPNVDKNCSFCMTSSEKFIVFK